jgi:hypothetical protein
MVVWGRSIEETLQLRKVAKDFEYGGGGIGADFAWMHRRTGDTDIYYVANLTDEPQDLKVRLRVANREAQLWHPDTGFIKPATYTSQGERTDVSLHLDQREMVFVVFPKPAASPSRVVPQPQRTTVGTITGSWRVRFAPGLGAPTQLEFPVLQSWTADANNGVKYFSGTATYTKSINTPQAWFGPGSRMFMDLGSVADLAEVSVNGKPFGLLWKPPYRIDVTGALRSGSNSIEVKVTNEWSNRILGDQLAPANQGVLSSGGGRGSPAASAQQPTMSGLLGPVTMIRQTAR